MWKNMMDPDRPQMTIQYATCALHAGYLRLQMHTQVVPILIAFPLQQWLHGCASKPPVLSRAVVSFRITYPRSKHVVLLDI
jgi:Ni,Fe-hydrogenase III small subunit